APTQTAPSKGSMRAGPEVVATPADGAASAESVAAEVMRLSGLDAHAAVIAATISNRFDWWTRSGGRPSAGSARLVTQRFGAEALRASVRHALPRYLPHPHAAALLGWLRSSLSRRIVEMENRASAAERLPELERFVNQLPSAAPGATRLALIHRLERAGQVIDGSAAVFSAATAALRLSVSPGASRQAPAAKVQIDHEDFGGVIDEHYRLRIMTSLVFTYAELSDADLARYVAFLESSTGRWFTRVTQLSLLAAL